MSGEYRLVSSLQEQPTLVCSVDRGTIPVWISGSGEPALVFLHGWTLDHSIWRDQFRCAGFNQRLVSLDRRGFGASTGPADAASDLDDLLCVIDELGIERAWLVGHSQGARVASAFCAQWPMRVDGLILLGPPPLLSTDSTDKEEIPLARFSDLVRAGRIEQFRREWANHPLMHSSHPTCASRLGEILASYRGRDLLAGQRPLEFYHDRLINSSIPKAIIVGEDDTPTRKSNAARLASSLPGSTLTTIPQAGHFCNMENPTVFNEIVRALLRKKALGSR